MTNKKQTVSEIMNWFHNVEWRLFVKEYLLGLKMDMVREIIKNQWLDLSKPYSRHDVLRQNIKFIDDLVNLPQIISASQKEKIASDYLRKGIEDISDINYNDV